MNVKCTRGIRQLIYVFLTLSVPCFAPCPSSESLLPYCSCDPTGIPGFISFETCYPEITCSNILNPLDLKEPVQATIGHGTCQMIIQDSTFQYLPHDLFKNTNFTGININKTDFVSLSDGDLAFEGLERHLAIIRIYESRFFNWDFSQLHHLQHLRAISFYKTQINGVIENVPRFNSLAMFIFVSSELSYISDHAFANLTELQYLILLDNDISEFKRSMLPVPANALRRIFLGQNKLYELPEDMFYAMPELELVDLTANRLVTLDEKVFSAKINTWFTFNITGNPLACDCRLLWLIRVKIPKWTYPGTCVTPIRLNGTYLTDLKTRDIEDC